MLTARDSGKHEQAVEFAKQGIRQYPRSDWLWRELGNELTRLTVWMRPKRAEHRSQPKSQRRLALALPCRIVSEAEELEKEIEALEHLYPARRGELVTSIDWASPTTTTELCEGGGVLSALAAAKSDTAPGSTWGWCSTTRRFPKTWMPRTPTAASWPSPDHEPAKEQLDNKTKASPTCEPGAHGSKRLGSSGRVLWVLRQPI